MGALLTGCSGGSSSAGASGPGSTGAKASTASAAESCLTHRWSVPAAQEFAEMGLGTLTNGGVSAVGGTVRITFAADHTYTFSYDRVSLSVGKSSGSASVNGPVTGTWRLSGDRLTTTVNASRIAVNVTVAGVSVTPSQTLNDALKNGMPSSSRVTCSSGKLVVAVPQGAAAEHQVTFTQG